jgi:hypothetical protein
MLCRVAIERVDVLEERIASIFWVKKYASEKSGLSSFQDPHGTTSQLLNRYATQAVSPRSERINVLWLTDLCTFRLHKNWVVWAGLADAVEIAATATVWAAQASFLEELGAMFGTCYRSQASLAWYASLSNYLTNWLTVRSWARDKRSPVVQLLENFPAFYGTRLFITAPTRTLHFSLDQSHPISPRSNVIYN